MEKFENINSHLLKELGLIRFKQKNLTLFSGVIFSIGVFLILLLIGLSLEAIFHFKPPTRIVLIAALTLLFLVVCFRCIFFPLYNILFRRHYPGLETLALTVGARFPELKDRLSNALQLFRNLKNNPEGYSTALIESALEKIDDEIKTVNLQSVVDDTGLKKASKFLGIVFVSIFIPILLFHVEFQKAAFYLSHPDVSYTAMVKYEFMIEPGNVKIQKGEDVTLAARIKSAEYVEGALLLLESLSKSQQNEWFLHPGPSGEFIYQLENVTDSLRYAFRVGEQTSSFYKIAVMELPLIRKIQVQLIYPNYTKIPTQYLDENNGDIIAIKGTHARMLVNGNKPLENAELVFSDDPKKELRINGTDASGDFFVNKSQTYYIDLTDNEKLKSIDPITYKIEAIPDQSPIIKIVAPAMDLDINQDTRIILIAEAEDDFGFTQAKLKYQIIRNNRPEPEPPMAMDIPLKNPAVEKISMEYEWDLATLNLNPSDMVQYYMEIFDNDQISGPKSAQSLTYMLRYPSMEEMYTEVDQTQQEMDDELKKVYTESQELKEKIDEIVEELKKDPKVSWEEKKNIEDALESQKKLFNDLEKIDKKLDEIIERAEKNELLSYETLKKYQELQELFNQLATPEFKKAMEELNKALQNIDPQQLQQAMNKMEFNQESFLKSIERTISLLKRIQIEQKLDELINKAQELAEREENLGEEAKKSPENKNDALASQQNEIEKDTQALESIIDSLLSQMAELPDMPMEDVAKAAEMLRQQAFQNQMQAAKNSFQQGKMQNSAQQAQQIQQALENFANMLQQAKQQMSQQQKQEVLQALRRSTQELLKLSQNQEELIGDTKKTRINTPKFNEMAERQLNMMQALSRQAEDLLALSQKTFFVTPEIGKALGKTMSEMKNALNAMEERNNSQANENQGNAMGALNETIRHLRSSMQSCSNSSSGTGMEQFMQQLQAAAGKQQSINAQTQELGQGSLSMQQQAALARLAAEQMQLKKNLEELANEAGSRSEILGRLDEVTQEMEEVAQELSAKQQVNSEVIQRQERILSRLLDAQRSMRTRDYSRKRESEEGKYYQARRVMELSSDMTEENRKRQEDLLKALKEGYSRDYRELIKRYFEAISRGTNENK
ncbi:hypothetical protein JW964_20780 [candidate division KSB1 bacterium]|nr:hypothetical protein [candidate division KSB1 bacterium]